MDSDRLLIGEPLFEVISLKHSSDCILRSQLDHHRRILLGKPFGIKPNNRLLRIKYLEDLFSVSNRIRLDLLNGHWWSCGVFARRVTNSTCEVSDEKDNFVSELLELTHFLQQHDMTEV